MEVLPDIAVSDDALRQVFTTFRMDFAPDLLPDPLSDAYRDRQMALYNGVSGKACRLENEATPADMGRIVSWLLLAAWR